MQQVRREPGVAKYLPTCRWPAKANFRSVRRSHRIKLRQADSTVGDQILEQIQNRFVRSQDQRRSGDRRLQEVRYPAQEGQRAGALPPQRNCCSGIRTILVAGRINIVRKLPHSVPLRFQIASLSDHGMRHSKLKLVNRLVVVVRLKSAKSRIPVVFPGRQALLTYKRAKLFQIVLKAVLRHLGACNDCRLQRCNLGRHGAPWTTLDTERPSRSCRSGKFFLSCSKTPRMPSAVCVGRKTASACRTAAVANQS